MTTREATPGPSALVCGGCGASPDPFDPFPFTCPNAGKGDVDHVLRRILDASVLAFPDAVSHSNAAEPFVAYRTLLHSYHRARQGGISDEAFLALVRRLDGEVARVDGHGFVKTPFRRNGHLSDALGFGAEGGVWVKDETGNVSGSHKGRHLMGVLLHLEVSELLGLSEREHRPRLAIASCGNAALAAAVVAAAGGWRLRVFVPTDAEPRVVERLRDLAAEIEICPRRPEDAGDPTYLRLLEDLADGAVPFTCQGNLNGLVIEGGETLGYEIAADLAAEDEGPLDHVVVQVGGGALASACAQAFDEAFELGALARCPRLHTVQTAGGHPLERAYRLVREHLGAESTPVRAEAAIRDAARNRSQYMWPWENEPKSIATGILDDETYDWLAVVAAMLSTGGLPVVASEECLSEAHELGKAAGFRADPTGTASLAGLLDLLSKGVVTPTERVAVLFTGVER
ncbi:MAG: pyridoxal-phosphate dependent enzyme [Acidimicrobiales bacterium]